MGGWSLSTHIDAPLGIHLVFPLCRSDSIYSERKACNSSHDDAGQTLGGEQRAPRGSAHTERLAQDGSAATGVPAGSAADAAFAAVAATVPLQPGPQHRPGRPPGAEPAAIPDAAATATAASATAAAHPPATAYPAAAASGSGPSASQHHVWTTWFTISTDTGMFKFNDISAKFPILKGKCPLAVFSVSRIYY